MDRKSIFILIGCVLLLFSWNWLTNKIYPPIPFQPRATNQVVGATNPVPAGTNQPVVTAIPPGAPKFVVHAETAEELLVLTNKNARYTFTSRGGGIKLIELLQYPETVSASRKKDQPTNQVATLNSTSAPPVLAILGDESLQGDGVFKLSTNANGARVEKSLSNGLTIVKQFTLDTNFLVAVSVRIKNGSDKQLSLPAQEWVAGAATPMGPQDNGMSISVLVHNGSSVETVGLAGYFNTNTSTMFVIPRTPKTEYAGTMTNVPWVSDQNQFFALITMPQKPATGMRINLLNLPPPDQEVVDSMPRVVRNPHALQTVIKYPAVILNAGEELTNNFNLYAGPKDYRMLAQLNERFTNDVVRVMSFGFFSPVSGVLLASMNWMHGSLSLGYGWIIIIITVIIRGIFWPLTQYSTKSMKKMQNLAPQTKAIQEKYKDDPQKAQQKTWELYKKSGVNPFSGCLPMLIQIPVFFGFYGMLSNAIELRGTPFLWMADLSKTDTLFVIPGLNFPFNLMPLFMGATMLWQTHLTPPSPGMDPAQQKIMRFLPLIILLFVYFSPSGLALYWTVQNLLSILQTKLINAQMKTATVTSTATATAPVPVAPQKKKK